MLTAILNEPITAIAFNSTFKPTLTTDATKRRALEQTWSHKQKDAEEEILKSMLKNTIPELTQHEISIRTGSKQEEPVPALTPNHRQTKQNPDQ